MTRERHPLAAALLELIEEWAPEAPPLLRPFVRPLAEQMADFVERDPIRAAEALRPVLFKLGDAMLQTLEAPRADELAGGPVDGVGGV